MSSINKEKKAYFLPLMIKLVISKNWAWLPSSKRLHEIFTEEIDGYKDTYSSPNTYANCFHKDVGDGWRARNG